MASTLFKSAVFVDSLFIKQTIKEAHDNYPDLEEPDISLEAIMSRIIGYTGFENYQVFYFEIPTEHLKPAIGLPLMGKSIKIQGKPVSFQLIHANLIAPELSDFFIENQGGFLNTILVADDIIYSDCIGRSGNFPNLTVFRRREATTRMAWDFYGRYAYFEDVIDGICKNDLFRNH